MSFQLVAPNKERLTLWAEALESGEFAQYQGRNLLIEYDDDTDEESKRSYCCLGVANEIAWRNGIPRPEGVDEGADMNLNVAAWYGVEPNPILNEFSAILLNDQEGWDFVKIASAIRHKYDLPERSQLG